MSVVEQELSNNCLVDFWEKWIWYRDFKAFENLLQEKAKQAMEIDEKELINI
jgi:hypothetical protein